ncbi:MAG: hypothetical protein COV09_01275 [Candidatus Vogelbacteria bacterium CG10_big_fil_rev_8_21_14_0_10_50_13]|uniref:Uncharacterized protein n=1 Tax=Candidatus Vogelbacteria bacterium CG10_big_fil_rev_8_21_14_0_10_50_13 TaxID=1975044 RepID=A0A2H0RG40_9BACT|nr:MAG: hypothetical protein COV09_01275 [Candidatus Vogelbacteria bacterium CG10_big_fil_rev_8_21_14_0_10_50_13]
MIKWIIIVVIIVLALSYWQIDLRGIVESEAGQANLAFVKEILTNIWQTYLLPAWEYIKEFLTP